VVKGSSKCLFLLTLSVTVLWICSRWIERVEEWGVFCIWALKCQLCLLVIKWVAKA